MFDRTGYEIFKEYALKDVTLGPKAKIAEEIHFPGYYYEPNKLKKEVNKQVNKLEINDL